ncbi:ATP-binding protein [Streptomyces sp. S07_1.15]|uniref:ATP-binding protein n=1 Tax=Streptomyces sp. S07_1.15 TaxID=2873925 RepID=UPI001D137670|nr:ATP-binding protein [Streptomyces sp. S07_1.15]MCC3655861.1 ATP-binding protein [Streptomyces sp. S07_1.15]
MRLHIRHIAGQLVWTTSGSVWALWRVTPRGGRYLPAAEQDEVLGHITALVRALAGTAPRLFGLCAQLDAGEVATQMIDGTDLETAPAWSEHVEAGLDLLERQEMHRRTVWLAVPLSALGRRAALSATFGSLWAETASALGLRTAPVSRAEVTAYQRQADRLAAAVGTGVELRPARPAEIAWMVQHAVHRGQREEPLLAVAETSDLFAGRLRGGQLRSPSYADLGLVRLVEGGQDATGAEGALAGEEDSGVRGGRGRWWRGGASPLGRRWLQVENETGIGYQAHLALAELPVAVAAGAADLFAQLEGLEFPVDYTVDLQVVPAERAKEAVRRKKKELVDQADQYGAQPAGMPSSLTEAAGDLGEMDARLSRSGVEVEVQAVTVLTVWGPTAAVCDARARALAGLLAGGDYRAVRPAGLQEALFTLGLPGAARPAPAREFTQYQLSEDWAMCQPFADTSLGDEAGALVGIDLDCGTVRPVLLNPADAPRKHASASVGVVGDLGAGKSVLLKLLTSSVVDRGGRAIVIDRTPIREYAAFAHTAASDRCQVIDAAAAQLSIDPLRVFPDKTGAHYALSYLTLQLGIGPMSASGAVLHRAVEEAAADPEPSMAKVLSALAATAFSGTPARKDAASTLADLLQIVSDNPLAAMVFDPDLPPVSLDADLGSDLVVITTTGLTLPPREAFASPEVLWQQPLEALIGRAVLYLIAAIARQAAFADPARFCSVVTDECYWLTSSAEGTALVHEILHDGRKHGAGLAAGAHDVDELGPDRGLIAYKLLARTTDRARAMKGLQYLGLDADDEELLRLVTTSLSPVGSPGREGEMLLRDPRMRAGRIKVIIPEVARIRHRITTTPGGAAADGRAEGSAPGEEGADAAAGGER